MRKIQVLRQNILLPDSASNAGSGDHSIGKIRLASNDRVGIVDDQTAHGQFFSGVNLFFYTLSIDITGMSRSFHQKVLLGDADSFLPISFIGNSGGYRTKLLAAEGLICSVFGYF